MGDAGPTEWLKEALALSVADETNKSESVAVESNELATEDKRVAHCVKHAIEAGKPWTAHPTSGEFEEGSSVEGDVTFVEDVLDAECRDQDSARDPQELV